MCTAQHFDTGDWGPTFGSVYATKTLKKEEKK